MFLQVVHVRLKNEEFHLQGKSIDWFLYERDIGR